MFGLKGRISFGDRGNGLPWLDTLREQAGRKPDNAVLAVRWNGRTVCRLAAAFVSRLDGSAEAALARAAALADRRLAAGPCTVTLAWEQTGGSGAGGGPGEAAANVLLDQPQPEATAPGIPMLRRLVRSPGRCELGLIAAEQPSRVFLREDGVVVGWLDLPAGAGLDLDLDATLPLGEGTRLDLLTDQGVQLTPAAAARPLKSPPLRGGDRVAGLLMRGAFNTRIVEHPPAERDLLVVYAIHTKARLLSPTHKRVIAEFRNRGATVCLINSFLGNATQLLADAKGVHLFSSRLEYGRDFASWCGFVTLHLPWVVAHRRVLFINDSLTGPLVDIGRMLDFFANTPAELSGLSDSFHRAYHLQSSIFQVGQAAWSNAEFRNFFLDYAYPDDRDGVIAQGEFALTATAQRAGLSVACMCPYAEVTERWLAFLPALRDRLAGLEERNLETGKRGPRAHDYALDWARRMAQEIRLGVTRNAQHTFWDTLVRDFGYPFVKRDLLMTNPEGIANLVLLNDLVDDAHRDHMRAVLADLGGTRVYTLSGA